MPDEKSGQKSADTLEEAMAMQDKMAREANEKATEEATAEQREAEEEAKADLAELGAAQEARDDEVYGRVAGAEDRRPGVGETATPSTEAEAEAEVDAQAEDTAKSSKKSEAKQATGKG